MPIVTATPRSNSNGEVVTEFLDTISTSPITYTFPTTQEKLKVKNNGYGSLQLTVNGSVVTVLPTESKEFYGSIDSFVISSSGGVQSFEVVGSNYKDEETQLTGSNAQQVSATENALDVWLKSQLDDTNDIVAIGDGSGNKLLTDSFPGITKASEQKTDNSIFIKSSDKILPALAGWYQTDLSASVVTNGNIAALRASKYRTLLTAPDQFTLTLVPATPVPSGSDITKSTGAAIDSSDFAIRDTAVHSFVIPTIGWKNFTIYISTDANFDQPLICGVRALGYGGTLSSKLVEFNLPAAAAISCGIGEGTLGIGGTAGAATAANQCWYDVPALSAGHNQLSLRFNAAIAPTNGSILNIMIVRRA